MMVEINISPEALRYIKKSGNAINIATKKIGGG